MSKPTITPVEWEDFKEKLGLSDQVSLGKARMSSSGQVTASAPYASLQTILARRCVDGERTQHLTSLIGKLLATGVGPEAALTICNLWNSNNIDPLEDDKVAKTVASIVGSDMVNHPDRYTKLQAQEPLFDKGAGRIDRFLAGSPPARRWLLKDLVVLGKAGAVIAPGGSSKSQLLLQLAVGVASGVAVADHWQIGEKGAVLVFSAEDDEDEIHRRLKRIVDHLSTNGHAAALAGLEDRLYVYSTIGHDTLLTKRSSNGEVSATVTLDRMLLMAEQHDDLKLIVIDPASRFRGGEENSNEDATRFVEALETLAKKTGASVLIAHHANKAGTSSEQQPGQTASRGASALTDGIRWQMNMSRPSDKQLVSVGADKSNSGTYVAATVTKTNYSAIPEPVLLERQYGGYLSAVNPATAKARAMTSAVMQVVAVLSQQSRPITARTLEDQYGGTDNVLRMPKHQVREVVKEAIQRGLVAGGGRKPLVLTPLATTLRPAQPQQNPATENASEAPKPPPRKED